MRVFRPPKPSRTLPSGASRKGAASRLLVLLTELTLLMDFARPRLAPPSLKLASPLPLWFPDTFLELEPGFQWPEPNEVWEAWRYAELVTLVVEEGNLRGIGAVSDIRLSSSSSEDRIKGDSALLLRSSASDSARERRPRLILMEEPLPGGTLLGSCGPKAPARGASVSDIWNGWGDRQKR